MAGNDKTMRAFLRGASAFGKFGLGLVLLLYIAIWISGVSHSLMPRKAESILWIAPWLLAGGVLNLIKHFKKEQRVQFSIQLLLLITLLLSFSAGWSVLAHSRFQSEQNAIDSLRKKCGDPGLFQTGPFFPKVIEVSLYRVKVNSVTLSFVMKEIKCLPFLCRVRFQGGIVSEDALVTLRAAFPNIVFVQEVEKRFP